MTTTSPLLSAEKTPSHRQCPLHLIPQRQGLEETPGQFQFRPEDLAKVKGMDPNRLAELIYSTKGGPKKLAQAANPSFLRRVMDEATNSLTNSLLWLYPTHLVNMTSSIYMLAARPTEKLIGSFAIGPKAGGDVLRQQAMKEYAYTVAALGDGLTADQPAPAGRQRNCKPCRRA